MDSGDAGRNQLVNIGNPDEHTVKEFAETVIRVAGSSSTIEHKPAREDDVMRRKPDITKAQQLLNWQPSVSLEDGLAKTIEWMRGKLQARIQE